MQDQPWHCARPSTPMLCRNRCLVSVLDCLDFKATNTWDSPPTLQSLEASTSGGTSARDLHEWLLARSMSGFMMRALARLILTCLRDCSEAYCNEGLFSMAAPVSRRHSRSQACILEAHPRPLQFRTALKQRNSRASQQTSGWPRFPDFQIQLQPGEPWRLLRVGQRLLPQGLVGLLPSWHAQDFRGASC